MSETRTDSHGIAQPENGDHPPYLPDAPPSPGGTWDAPPPPKDWPYPVEAWQIAFLAGLGFSGEREPTDRTPASVWRPIVEKALEWMREPCTPIDRANARGALAGLLRAAVQLPGVTGTTVASECEIGPDRYSVVRMPGGEAWGIERREPGGAVLLLPWRGTMLNAEREAKALNDAWNAVPLPGVTGEPEARPTAPRAKCPLCGEDWHPTSQTCYEATRAVPRSSGAPPADEREEVCAVEALEAVAHRLREPCTLDDARAARLVTANALNRIKIARVWPEK